MAIARWFQKHCPHPPTPSPQGEGEPFPLSPRERGLGGEGICRRPLTLIGILTLIGGLSTIAPLPAIAQVTAPPHSTGTGIPGIAASGYVLGVGDRVQLDLFNVPEYSGAFEVQVDGALNLPVVGLVPVQGLTVEQATQVIEERFASILRRPIATLSLLERRPITVAIAGEITRPGSYTLAPEEVGQVPNLTEVLRLAGGVTPSADISQIQIRRPGSAQSVTVNLWDLVQSGNLQPDLLVRDGDSIFIPVATNPDLATARRLASTSFAASQVAPITVAVVGEVNRPGPYTLSPVADSPNSPTIPTLTQAIQSAGGITQTADIRAIQIRRTLHSGEQQLIAVNLWQLLQAGELAQDLPLQAGDTVLIPTATALTPSEMTELASASFSPSTIAINVVGEVRSPGVLNLPPNTPLTQAILAAGGYTGRARQSSVELIRLNPDGTISRRSIPVDFDRGVDLENNPALQNNDTIVISRSGLATVGDALGGVISRVGGIFTILRLFGL